MSENNRRQWNPVSKPSREENEREARKAGEIGGRNHVMKISDRSELVIFYGALLQPSMRDEVRETIATKLAPRERAMLSDGELKAFCEGYVSRAREPIERALNVKSG